MAVITRAEALGDADDPELVAAAQRGDCKAFDELYRRHFRRLEAHCRRKVGDPLLAEELAQETFARAFAALPGFGGDRRFYPWLTVIASRLVVDDWRRRSRAEPSAEVDAGTCELGVLEQLVHDDDVHLAAAALDRLKPRHRDVLELREQQRWSYRRIAGHYGVSVGTVDSLLVRARRALKREFDQLSKGLAGVPALAAARGGVTRWAVRLRSFGGWDAGLTAVAAKVAVVVAVATIVVPGLVPGGGPEADRSGSSGPVRAGAPLADPPAPATTVADAPGPGEPGPVEVPEPELAPEDVEPAPGPLLEGSIAPGVTGTDAESAEDEARRAPVGTGAGGATVGVDPGEVVDDLTAPDATPAGWAEQLHTWITEPEEGP